MDQMVSANLVFFIQKPCCPGCLPVHFQISYSLALSLFALPLPPLTRLLGCLVYSFQRDSSARGHPEAAVPLSSAQAEARPSLALSTLDLCPLLKCSVLNLFSLL